MNEATLQPEVSNIVGGPMAPAPDTPVDVVDVQFHTGAKVYYFDPNQIQVHTGDHIIIETARGPEFGICAQGNHQVPFRDIVPPLRKVVRIATDADERALEANKAKEKRAFEICQQRILEHKLDMQLVSAEYAFDGSKILFFFTADDRVDFRELVKNLASIFRTRIELRQIGVRDKAKMVGGLGICGRPFCCTEFLDDFQPVSIKMAKTQNLSLNPTKISGTCGRLMCCLKYEQDAYEDLLKSSPKQDSFVDTPGGRGTIVEVNLLRQTVRVRMEEQPDTIETYPNTEIAVLRSGKAKKNDPPIPADLAPISGSGKRPKLAATEKTDAPMQLDPIRFRYRPDDIVEEQPQEEPEVPAEPMAKPEVTAASEAKPERRKREPRAPRQDSQEPAAAEGKQGPRRKRPERKPQQEPQQKPEKAEKVEKEPAQAEEPKQEKSAQRPRPQKPRKPRPEGENKAEGKAEGKPERKPQQEKPKAEKPRTEEVPADGEQKSGEQKPKRNNYRRRHYHSNKPKAPGGEGS